VLRRTIPVHLALKSVAPLNASSFLPRHEPSIDKAGRQVSLHGTTLALMFASDQRRSVAAS
jgi:hypothetical protein